MSFTTPLDDFAKHCSRMSVQNANKKARRSLPSCFFTDCLLRYFRSFVGSAASANAMSQFVFTAIVAFDHAWDL